MKISRRNFIKTGSLGLTIPFIEALPQMSFAASPSGSLKRILFFTLSQSWLSDQAFPTLTNYQTGPEGVRYIPLNSINGDISKLFPASKYGQIKSKMNLLRGFDAISSTIGNGGHSISLALGAGFESSSSMQLKSIDRFIADSGAFYTTPPFKSVFSATGATEGNAWRHHWSYSLTKASSDILGATSPDALGAKQIFSELFTTALPSVGGVTTSTIDSNLSRRIALNNALTKLNNLSKNSNLSTNSKNSLIQHADIINKLLPTIAPTSNSGTSVGSSCAKPTISSSINDSMFSTSGNGARLKACMDMFYMAFNCQLTNIITFHPVVAADNSAEYMGDEVNGADVKYHFNVGHSYEPSYYLSTKGFLMDNLLYLVNLMDSTKESNGLSMLDNSLVVVVSNDGSFTHSSVDLSVVTFGSLGGTIKTGNYVNYQRPEARVIKGSFNGKIGGTGKDISVNLGRPYNSFFNTILNALKIPHSGFGNYGTATDYSQFVTAAAKQASLPILT